MRKKHEFISALFSPESTGKINCLKSQKLQRNGPTVTFMVRDYELWMHAETLETTKDA